MLSDEEKLLMANACTINCSSVKIKAYTPFCPAYRCKYLTNAKTLLSPTNLAKRNCSL